MGYVDGEARIPESRSESGEKNNEENLDAGVGYARSLATQGRLSQAELDSLLDVHQRLNTGRRVEERELDSLVSWADRAQEALGREEVNTQRRKLVIRTFGPEKYEEIKRAKDAVGDAMEGSLLYVHAENPHAFNELLKRWSSFANKVEIGPLDHKGRNLERVEAVLKFADAMFGQLEPEEAREAVEEFRKRYGNI